MYRSARESESNTPRGSEAMVQFGGGPTIDPDAAGAFEIAEEAKQVDPLKLDRGHIAAHAIHTEYSIICRNPVDGIYVIPSAFNPYEWFGMLFVRRGEYGGAILRFSIEIPDDFPNTCNLPTVTFDKELFHPSIDLKQRVLNMERYFPDRWKKDKHHIVNILLVIQRIFFSLDVPVETAANAEAALLWKDQKDKFREMVRHYVSNTRHHIYDDPPKYEDPNCIWVTPWDPSVHEAYRQRMMLLGSGCGSENGAWSDRGHRGGYSWLDTERMTYMTEPYTSHTDDSLERAAADRAAHGIERLDLSAVTGDDDDADYPHQKHPDEEREDDATPAFEKDSHDATVIEANAPSEPHRKLERSAAVKQPQSTAVDATDFEDHVDV